MTSTSNKESSVFNTRHKKNFSGKFLLACCSFLVVLFFLLGQLFFHFYNVSVVNGVSMYPTFHNGDVLVWKTEKNPVDEKTIVMVKKPDAWAKATQTETGDVLIKRVVAKSGDVLSYDAHSRDFLVNGKTIRHLPDDYTCVSANFSHKLNNEIFVMGDNAEESYDSRRTFCDGMGDDSFIPNKFVVSYVNVSFHLGIHF